MLYYGMRLVPNYTFRRSTAWTLAKTFCASTATPPRTPVAEPLAELRRNGITMLAPLLTDAQIEEVLAYLNSRTVITPAGQEFRLSDPVPGTKLASYPLGTILECPHLLEAANREDILSIAREYIGARPLISATRIDCTFPSGDGPVDVQRFHRDYDDWRFFKLFIYLTDTDVEEGPHEFVRTSHRYSGRWRANFFSPDYITRQYGPDAVARVCGPPGTSFVADTWGIHRGSVPRNRLRVLFQVTYSLLPTYRFDYTPVRTPRAKLFDRGVNRLLMA
jgi:hypothetical protein